MLNNAIYLLFIAFSVLLPSLMCSITIRPVLDAVLKQGMLRVFQHGLIRLCTPCFRRRKYSRAETTLLLVSNQR